MSQDRKTIDPAPVRPGHRFFQGLRPLAGYSLGVLGLVLVVVVVMGALLADVLAPYDPVAIDVSARLQGPSWSHWLGTDHLGRDLFSRVLMGGRVGLQVALLSISVALALGLALGMLAGFGPRWLDSLLLTSFDTVRSFPTIMFALAVVALLGPSLNTIMLVVVMTATPAYGRIVRTQTRTLRDSEFILAERSMGVPALRILAVHVLPNVLGPLVILASMDIPSVIAMEAGLSFLGLGVRPPTPSWGSLLNDGYAFVRNTPWPILAGTAPLVLVTLGFTFLGESLLEIFDPKRKRRAK